MDIEGLKSVPTRFGQSCERVYDEYPIYKFPVPPQMIDQYFPGVLRSFPTKSVSDVTKHFLYYSKPIVVVTRYQYKDEQTKTITFDNFLKETHATPPRYNFVILNDCLSLIRIPRLRHVTYQLLSKHIILSNRSKSVRFAGEMWMDEEGHLFFNNNSGTYRPNDQMLEQAIKFFDVLFPTLHFQGLSFQTSGSSSSISHRLSEKIQKKFHHS